MMEEDHSSSVPPHREHKLKTLKIISGIFIVMNIINVAILFFKRSRIDSTFVTFNIAASFVFIILCLYNCLLELMCKKGHRIYVTGIVLSVLAFLCGGVLYGIGLIKDIDLLKEDAVTSDQEIDNEGGIIFESVTFVLNLVYCVITIVFSANIKKMMFGKNFSEVQLEGNDVMDDVMGTDDVTGGHNNNNGEIDDYLPSSRGVSFDYSGRNASIDFTRGTSMDIQRSSVDGGAAIIDNNDN